MLSAKTSAQMQHHVNELRTKWLIWCYLHICHNKAGWMSQTVGGSWLALGYQMTLAPGSRLCRVSQTRHRCRRTDEGQPSSLSAFLSHYAHTPTENFLIFSEKCKKCTQTEKDESLCLLPNASCSVFHIFHSQWHSLSSRCFPFRSFHHLFLLVHYNVLSLLTHKFRTCTTYDLVGCEGLSRPWKTEKIQGLSWTSDNTVDILTVPVHRRKSDMSQKAALADPGLINK